MAECANRFLATLDANQRGKAVLPFDAPGIVAGYIPWRICRWHVGSPLLGISSFRVLGVLFRYVRNPIYVAVLSLILGQGLLFGSIRILEYGIAVWVAFSLFVVIYEEPTLRKRYGVEYEEFCANVPRWIPRLRP
jgi:hypothetical protein